MSLAIYGSSYNWLPQQRPEQGWNILSTTDLKHGIEILTLADNIYDKFKEFPKLHSLGNGVDPNSSISYGMNRAYFDNRKHHVNPVFFQKLGKLSDHNIDKMVTLLVDYDIAEGAMKYLRLSLYKNRHHHQSNHTDEDWCIH